MTETPSSTPSLARQQSIWDRWSANPSAALNALLDDPLAATRIRETSSVILHRLIAYIGLHDSSPILAMAKPEQVRDILDLELWQADRLKAIETLEWLLELTTLPDEIRRRDFEALDIELIGWLIKRHTQIYIAEEEQYPEESEGTLFKSPDGYFVLEIFAEHQTTVDQLIKLIETLFQDDHQAARRLLQNLMWELPDELEEMCYRWRNGRLQDLGFADPADALLAYAYLAPASVTADERTADSGLIADPDPVDTTDLIALTVKEPSFWTQVMALLTEEAELHRRLTPSLFALCNRVMSADQIATDDPEGARDSLERLHWRLSLGLESLCQGDPQRGQQVLTAVALIRIARLGFSLTLDLRREIIADVRHGRLGHQPGKIDRLDVPLSEQIGALITARPQFFDLRTGERRPFKTLADLDLARHWIRQARGAAELMDALAPPLELVANRSFGDVFRTLLLNRLLGRTGPIDHAGLHQFLLSHIRDAKFTAAVWQQAQTLAGDGALHQELARRWLVTLEETIGAIDPSALDLRFVEGLCLTY